MRLTMKSSKPCGFGRNEDTPTKRAGGSRRNAGRPLVRIGGCSRESSRARKGRSEWFASVPPTRFVSNDTRKFVLRPILTILPGNPTSRNGLMCRWSARSRENDGCCTSGKNKEVSAHSVTKRSPKSQDGTAIMYFGDPKEDQIGQKIGFCFIPSVISKFIARVYTWRNRVR